MRLLLLIIVVAATWLLVLWRRKERARATARLPEVHRWRHRTAVDEDEYPYYAKTYLLTKSERQFYRVLREAVGDDFTIAMSVRLADVINCSLADWRAGYGPLISSKQIDFVLCEQQTTRIRLAIELDDPTHGLDDRRERDEFLDNAMEAAGVPLLRVETAEKYDTLLLREEIYIALDEELCTPRAASA